MDFVAAFKFILKEFTQQKIDCALIGGFALQSAGVSRATGDVDMLILSEDKDKVKSILLKRGYKLIHESKDVMNFVSDDDMLGRTDFLLAHRKYALSMLERAEEKNVLNGKFKIKVIRVEDQIGLKVQSSSNDSRRFHRDMADIELLISSNYSNLDVKLLREYFGLFNRQDELEKILKKLKT